MHLCYLSDLTLADASNLVRLYTNDTTRKYLGGPLEVSLAQTRAHADINTQVNYLFGQFDLLLIIIFRNYISGYPS